MTQLMVFICIWKYASVCLLGDGLHRYQSVANEIKFEQ